MIIQGFWDIVHHAKNIHPEIFKDEKNVVFLDIGSGRGLVPLMFAFYTKFSKAIGVEIVETCHKEATDGRKELVAKYPQYKKEISKIEYILEDVFKINFKDLVKQKAPSTKNPKLFIWISSLCCPPNIMESLAKKLENEAPKGSIIFTSKA